MSLLYYVFRQLFVIAWEKNSREDRNDFIILQRSSCSQRGDGRFTRKHVLIVIRCYLPWCVVDFREDVEEFHSDLDQDLNVN